MDSFDAPGYYNNCTMKSGCFGGVNDNFVLAGSDDFNLYAWEIPPEAATLTDAEKGEGGGRPACGMTVARATHVLRGHKSIVNQARTSEIGGPLLTLTKYTLVCPVADACSQYQSLDFSHRTAP